MATQILERVPVDRIDAEARQVRVSRAVLTVLAALLYGLGVAAAKAWGLFLGALGRLLWCVGASAAWTVAAVKLGWDDARRPSGVG